MTRDEFIEGNLPLVHKLANRFRGRGVEYEELYAAGCVGPVSYTHLQLAGCVSSAESGEAVAEMVSRYTGLVLALAGKYSGGADYEELVSDGLDALLSALRKYSPEKGSFSGFASVCVSNRMKNAVDRAKRRNERLEELADEDIPDSSPTPEELVIGRCV